MAVAMVLGFMLPSAMADQPSETTRVVCSRVEIQLPHDIVFYSNQGTIDARVETNIGPGQATVYRLRKKLAKSASRYADAHLAKHADEIKKAFKTMTKEQGEHAYNRWKWEIQRQYFARVEREPRTSCWTPA